MSAATPAVPVQVRLLNFPTDIYVRTQEHADDLVRELTLIANSRAVVRGESYLPHRLLDLIGELTHQFDGMAIEAERIRDAAIDRGERRIDLTYVVPPSVADACRHIDGILDEADEFCRQGEHLLTLATPAEALVFRRWYLDEFINQIDGAAPRPWSDDLLRA